MPLTHLIVLRAQPREKADRLYDRHGLYLEVSPRGGKWWRARYQFAQREQRLSVSTSPMVGLKSARQRCMRIRTQAASGVDPSAQRKLAKQRLARRDDSFEVWPVNGMRHSPAAGLQRTATEFSDAWRLMSFHGSVRFPFGS